MQATAAPHATSVLDETILQTERILAGDIRETAEGDVLKSTFLLNATANELLADGTLLAMAQAIKAGRNPLNPKADLRDCLHLYNIASASMTTAGQWLSLEIRAEGAKHPFDMDVQRIAHKSTMLYLSLYDQAEAFAKLG